MRLFWIKKWKLYNGLCEFTANHDMQLTGVVVTVAFVIILFEVFPEKSIWSIPVKQPEEHIIATPAGGGFSFLLMQKQEFNTLTKEQQRYWKRILIVDDDSDVTVTFKAGIEENNNDPNTRIEVYTSNDPISALLEFKPSFYDLLLVDINMPHMNGFDLCEKILAVDINVRICFMSSIEINREALREVYPTLGLGCFIRKPVTIDYLLKRIRSELD